MIVRSLFRATDRFLLSRLRTRGYRSENIATRTGSIHLLRAKGEGIHPPVVVLHGLAAASHFYENVFDPMRPLVRSVVAPDLPGHGASPLPAHGPSSDLTESVAEALSKVLEEPAIFVGNSLGGAVSIRIALTHPELVRALFLIAPGGAPMDEAARKRFLDRFALRSHGEALAFVDDLFVEKHPQRQLIAWGTRHRFASANVRALIRRVEDESFLTVEELTRLTMPVHVLWGGADRVLLPQHETFFRNHLPPHATMETVAHFGHTPQIDHPRELQQRIQRFIVDLPRAHARTQSQGDARPSR
jgi:pimeloyl-ACP methyl ester carboxylesterase